MSFGLIMKLYHVLFAFLFISGIVTQNITFIQAARAGNLHVACALLKLSDRCETFIVFPSALCLLVFGMFTAWGQGWTTAIFANDVAINWLTLSILLFTIPAPIFIVLGYYRHKTHKATREHALRQEMITPELRRIFRNPFIIAYRFIELVIVLSIIALMVLKPL